MLFPVVRSIKYKNREGIPNLKKVYIDLLALYFEPVTSYLLKIRYIESGYKDATFHIFTYYEFNYTSCKIYIAH